MSESSTLGRTRTYSWQDPQTSANAVRYLSGLEFLQAIARGELPAPPIVATLNMALDLVEEGRVIFAVVPAEYHYNPIGTVHGGLACTLLDSAMSCAVQTMLPSGVGYTTLELKVNLTRPITVATGRIACEGRVIYVGGRTATAEGRITDANGALLAHGTTTCIVFRPSKD